MAKWSALVAIVITIIVELAGIKLIGVVIGEFSLNMKWVVGIGCAIFLFLFFLIYVTASSGAQVRMLRENYERALTNLSKNPTDYQVRLQALQCGREYYASKRQDNKLTVFDEQAIQNDIYTAGGR